MIKLLARPNLKLSHKFSHKLKDSFQDSPNVLCTFGRHEESISYFPLNCLLFAAERSVFQSKVRGFNINLLSYTDSVLTHTFHFGKSFFITITNAQAIHAWIDIISFNGHFFFRRIVFLKDIFQCTFSQHLLSFWMSAKPECFRLRLFIFSLVYF